jgi:5'(3')-deoxyribonucleotidase
MRKIIYIDLDNTIADYIGKANYFGINPNEAKHITDWFINLEPMPGAIESYNKLAEHFEVYILSTAPWSNPHSLYEKMLWVKKYLPTAYKNVIFSHHKDLNIGDYLIDDSERNGAGQFTGEHIKIHSDKFPNWDSVIEYIFNKENIQ